MSLDTPQLDVGLAHRHFAADCYNRAWALIEKLACHRLGREAIAGGRYQRFDVLGMGFLDSIQYREATSADVPAMAQCRLTDPAAGDADTRMAAYPEGEHHPQQALRPRIGYVALDEDTVIGYITGHRTLRHGCDGEVQYLFVAPEHRRRGIATALLRRLAGWFLEQGASKVCVNVDIDSPAAEPFYASQGATALNRAWYLWEDIGAALT